MDVLTDDHEREEAVKKWWHNNWKPIIGGIVIALAALVGFKQYQAYELKQSQAQALTVYQLQNNLATNTANAQTEALAFIENNNNLYGALVAIDLAKIQITTKEFDKALANLDFAAKNGGDLVAPLSHIVKARIQASLGDFNLAIDTLKAINSQAYAIEINELLGDIYMQNNQKDEAHDAYKKAYELSKEKGLIINPLLQIKYNNVLKSGEEPLYLIGQ